MPKTFNWNAIEFDLNGSQKLSYHYVMNKNKVEEFLVFKLEPYEIEFELGYFVSETVHVEYSGVTIFNSNYRYRRNSFYKENQTITEELSQCTIKYNQEENEFKFDFGGGKYLIFCNEHNGYYSHSLTVRKNGQDIFYTSF